MNKLQVISSEFRVWSREFGGLNIRPQTPNEFAANSMEGEHHEPKKKNLAQRLVPF